MDVRLRQYSANGFPMRDEFRSGCIAADVRRIATGSGREQAAGPPPSGGFNVLAVAAWAARGILPILLLSLLSVAKADDTESSALADAEPPVVLDPLIIQGRREFLYESDRQLANVIKGLPDMGEGLAPAGTFVDKLSDYYDKHKDPNDLPTQQQRMLLKSLGRADEALP